MSWESTSYKDRINTESERLIKSVISAQSEEELTNLSTAIVDHFKNIIKDFFSSEGEGDKIKKIYASVYDYGPSRKRLDIQDINASNSTYCNYLSGMDVFITKTMNDPTDVMCDKIKEFMNKDDVFVRSLFGDGTNVKRVTGVTVQEALVNLEVLIDFIPKLDECPEYVKKVFLPSTSNSEVQYNLIKMYLLSLIRYSSQLINGVFESFHQIDRTLNAPIFSQQESVKEEPFKLLL